MSHSANKVESIFFDESDDPILNGRQGFIIDDDEIQFIILDEKLITVSKKDADKNGYVIEKTLLSDYTEEVQCAHFEAMCKIHGPKIDSPSSKPTKSAASTAKQ